MTTALMTKIIDFFFYENKMWANYKIAKKQLNAIVKKNVMPADQKYSNYLNIFYKSKKLKSISIKNKSYKWTRNYNVGYQYT